MREELLDLHRTFKLPHIGSELSCLDIMIDLHFGILQKDDVFILSKGHAAYAFYAVMHERGLISDEIYATAGKNGSILAEHTTYPEYIVKTGSLGHGLPIGAGMALARKLGGQPGRIYVLCSDGELQEGSMLESMYQAARFKLDNLTTIIDSNKWQAYDRTDDIFSMRNVESIFKDSGWSTIRIDGHDHHSLSEAASRKQTGPQLILADTVLGKGVDYMEDRLESHYKPPR